VHVFLIPHWFTVTFGCSVALIALWKGDWRARVIGCSEVVMLAVGDYLCHTWACWGAAAPPLMLWRATIEDGFVLAICLACAWRAERYWVLWACSFGLLGVVSDTMGVFVPRVTAWADASASIIFTYLVVATVLVGVWSSPRAPAKA
jgi:hypothetical protein